MYRGVFLFVLSVVAGTLFAAEKQKLPVDISAKNGVKFFDEQNYLEALDDVSISRGANTIYGQLARIDYEKKNNKRELMSLTVQGQVLSVSPQATIYAEKGQYYLPTDQVTYTGSSQNPTVKLFAPSGTILAQKELVYQPKKQLAIVRGSGEVHSTKTPHKLFGEEIRIFFKKNEGTTGGKEKVRPQEEGPIFQGASESIDRLEADQNVHLVLPGKVATGDHALYKANGNIIELWGNVSVTDDNKQLKGAYAIVYKDKGQSEVYASLPKHLKSGISGKEKKKRVKIVLLPT